MNILYKNRLLYKTEFTTFLKMCSVYILIIYLTKDSFISVGSSHKNYILLKSSDKK